MFTQIRDHNFNWNILFNHFAHIHRHRGGVMSWVIWSVECQYACIYIFYILCIAHLHYLKSMLFAVGNSSMIDIFFVSIWRKTTAGDIFNQINDRLRSPWNKTSITLALKWQISLFTMCSLESKLYEKKSLLLIMYTGRYWPLIELAFHLGQLRSYRLNWNSAYDHSANCSSGLGKRTRLPIKKIWGEN